jgi:hypothetical protein
MCYTETRSLTLLKVDAVHYFVSEEAGSTLSLGAKRVLLLLPMLAVIVAPAAYQMRKAFQN